jgi:putative tricarboxylic transport membrane protein
MEFVSNAVGLYATSLPFFLNLATIGFLLLGTAIGITFGAIPGLTSTMSLALFTPLTFGLDPKLAIVFLIAIYAAAVYGGSLSAILINVPGTPSAIVTGLEGYPMGQRGEAGRAIGLATLASAIGGLFGMLVLMLVAPAVAKFALKLHSSEYALVALLGISLIAYISGENIVKGLLAGFIGLLIATVGMDPMGAYPRFTFGLADLVGGVELIPALIGIFGVTEVFMQVELGLVQKAERQKISGILSCLSEIKRFWGVILRSSPIGTFIGAVPGAGGSIAAMTSYAIEKRVSKSGIDFGTGVPEGIVAPESANNASVGGALIPMLTLGVPGDPMTAVLIGALLFHGLAPGPLLFQEHPDFISAIFIALTLSCFLILLFGIGGSKLLAKLLTIPKYVLMPAIMIFCVVGSYTIRQSLFDIGVAIACGILGYLLRKVEVPIAPIALGLILGPLLEDNLRRTLMVSGGSFAPFITRPGSLMLTILIIIILSVPFIQNRLRSKTSLQT